VGPGSPWVLVGSFCQGSKSYHLKHETTPIGEGTPTLCKLSQRICEKCRSLGSSPESGPPGKLLPVTTRVTVRFSQMWSKSPEVVGYPESTVSCLNSDRKYCPPNSEFGSVDKNSWLYFWWHEMANDYRILMQLFTLSYTFASRHGLSQAHYCFPM